MSRNTIRKYLRDDQPPGYQRTQPAKRLQLVKQYQSLLIQWYEHDQQRPKREHRTAHKYFEQLVAGGYGGSYTTVCRFIRTLKQDKTTHNNAFIPLHFEPGDALQFDWSQECVLLAGTECRIKVAQFRLSYSRKPFVRAYVRESQEMLLDAFNHALNFYQGVPKRVLIDNPKTMVVRIGTGKEQEFHPRFMALMNHYVLEPVACTPSAGWEKGQIENQVQFVRNQFFKPQLSFDDLESLNAYLLARCEELAQSKRHPGDQSNTVEQVFTEESKALRPLGRPFDGYVEKAFRVSPTCLVRYDSNHYSVPYSYAKQVVSLRVYANHIVIISDQTKIAEHVRCFGKREYSFEPWHYVPLLKRKPGALRNGAPFHQWALPQALMTLKVRYLKRPQGDRDFVQLLLLIEEHGMDAVVTACELALEEQTTRLPAIINLIHRLTEPDVKKQVDGSNYPQLESLPIADCQRYEQLRQHNMEVTP